jgi:hypothetical protein
MSAGTEATAVEREAELMALQAAFDEYIASSRELEEELDAELAKVRTKNHAKSNKQTCNLTIKSLTDSGLLPITFKPDAHWTSFVTQQTDA